MEVGWGEENFALMLLSCLYNTKAMETYKIRKIDKRVKVIQHFYVSNSIIIIITTIIIIIVLFSPPRAYPHPVAI